MSEHANTTRILNAKDRRTLVLAALGGALEYYDFIVFIFLTTWISLLFFPPDTPRWLSQLQTFGIFAVGFLARPIGGIAMAHFGDLKGRKGMFTLSIMLMVLPTWFIGLLPTYASIGIAAPILLLLLRVLQGMAMGGEVPAAWVFVAEHVPARHGGFGLGVLTAGFTGGIFLGSIVAAVVIHCYSHQALLDYGWRIPFLVGGIFGFFAMYLRRFLSETPVFEAMRAQRALASTFPLNTVLHFHRRAIALSTGFTWVLASAIVVIILYTPTYLQTYYHIAPNTVLIANVVATLSLTLGCVGFGRLIDVIGAGRTLLLGSMGFLLSSMLFYTQLSPKISTTALIAGYALAGFSVGFISVVPYSMVRLFPPAIRLSGISFSYNVAYAIFGGLTPVIIQLWVQRTLMAPAYYMAAIAVFGIGLGTHIWYSSKNRLHSVFAIR